MHGKFKFCFSEFFFSWRFLFHAWLNLLIQNLCIGRAMQRDPLQRELCSLCLWVFYWWHEKWSSVLKELQILMSWDSQVVLVVKNPSANARDTGDMGLIQLWTSTGLQKKQGSSGKNIYIWFGLCQRFSLCGWQQTMENSWKDVHTRSL